MKGARQLKSGSIRLPDELQAWLKERAEENRRSFNGEVVVRLEQSRVQEEQGGRT